MPLKRFDSTRRDSRPQGRAAIRIALYILKDLVPQFLSALIVICSVIVVSQLLRLSEVLVTFGVSLENIFLPFLYIILPFLSVAIPMANLFAVVLTFGRLSADGEYAALLASGYPLSKAAVPVLSVALILSLVGAACATYLEAWGRREMVQFFYRKTQTELDNMVKYKMQAGVFLDDFLGYVLYAEEISEDRTTFTNVLLAPGGRRGVADFTLLAPGGRITGSVETGDLRLSLNHGVSYSRTPQSSDVSVLRFAHAEIDLLKIFHEQIMGSDSSDDDYRGYPPEELLKFIHAVKKRGSHDIALYRSAAYLFHQRLAAPFAALTFAFFGMVLGISDPRRGRSIAYVGAIVTIIIGYVMMMGGQWLVKAGYVPVPVGAWMPNLLLCAFGIFLAAQKNRLPPSEGTLDSRNLPVLGRFFRSW